MEGDNYPPFNGIEISPIEYEKVNVYSVAKGWRIEKTAKYMGHRVYKDVNLPIPYTGKLLLGDEFLAEYYTYLGNQKSWAYNVLLELILVNGVAVEINDYSDEAKRQRERVDIHGRKNPLDFRQDSFSLDYNDKACWNR